jgi:uncharacterized protein (DUF1501 family)
MQIDRRSVLLGLLAAGVAPRLTLAAAPTDKRLVVVVLRGAWDGLMVVPPYGDPAYASLRGAFDMGRPGEGNGVTKLDGFFGLHPALDMLTPFWSKGEFIPVQAVATTHRGRSHFEGQDILEAGVPVLSGHGDGWLNRALALMPRDGDRRLGLAVGQTIPLTLRGATPIASWAPTKMSGPSDDLMKKIQVLWREDATLGPVLSEGLKAKGMADEVLSDDDRMGDGRGGDRAFVSLAKAAGGFLAAKDGPRLAVLDIGGWDTHAQQGTAKGRLAQNLQIFGTGLAALAKELGSAWQQTAVVCVSEFGRTAVPNGTGGTDHGTGGLALLLGGALRGGRVQSDWPGLARSSLYEGRDLKPTLDMRGLYKAVLRDHLGLAPEMIERKVFPDSAPAKAPDGLFKT